MKEKPPQVSMAGKMAPLLQGQVVGIQPLRVQTVPLVRQVLQDIGFAGVVNGHCGDEGDVPVEKIVEALVHCRLQNPMPVPLYQVESWFSKTVLPNVLGVPSEKLNDVRLGRVLEALAPAAKAMWLQLVLHAHKAYRFNLNLAIYDTSSVYVEGEYVNSLLLRFGYSRDKRPDCKQFNLGLNVTGEDGVPLMYHLTPGNTEDSSTVPMNICAMQELYKGLGASTDLCVLGDRAMLNPEYVHLYLLAKVNFIGSMRKCALNDAVLKSVTEAQLLECPLSYLAERYRDAGPEKQEAERYWAARTHATIPASKEIEGSTDVSLPVLVVLGAGKRRLDEQHRESLLAKTETRLGEILQHLNKGKYLKRAYTDAQLSKALSKYPSVKGMLAYQLTGEEGALALSWSRVDSIIADAATLDGRYAIYFVDESLSDIVVFKEFKSRDRVEKRVDDIKGTGPVVTRPVYLHKDERIKGLVFVCMIALLVTALEELQVKRRLQQSVTGLKIQQVFSDFEASLHTFADRSQLIVMPTPNIWQRQILASLDVHLSTVAPVIVTSQWTQFADATKATECPWEYQPKLDQGPGPEPSG
jgi:transposase